MEWYQLTNEDEVASPALLLFEERIELPALFFVD